MAGWASAGGHGRSSGREHIELENSSWTFVEGEPSVCTAWSRHVDKYSPKTINVWCFRYFCRFRWKDVRSKSNVKTVKRTWRATNSWSLLRRISTFQSNQLLRLICWLVSLQMRKNHSIAGTPTLQTNKTCHLSFKLLIDARWKCQCLTTAHWKSSGMVSSKRFKLDCSSSVVAGSTSLPCDSWLLLTSRLSHTFIDRCTTIISSTLRQTASSRVIISAMWLTRLGEEEVTYMQVGREGVRSHKKTVTGKEGVKRHKNELQNCMRWDRATFIRCSKRPFTFFVVLLYKFIFFYFCLIHTAHAERNFAMFESLWTLPCGHPQLNCEKCNCDRRNLRTRMNFVHQPLWSVVCWYTSLCEVSSATKFCCTGEWPWCQMQTCIFLRCVFVVLNNIWFPGIEWFEKELRMKFSGITVLVFGGHAYSSCSDGQYAFFFLRQKLEEYSEN